MQLLRKVILLQTVLIYIEIIASLPTFGNEYVHIKVHLPKDKTAAGAAAAGSKPHAPVHPPVAPPVPKHKVIHHYHHRRRRPTKKQPVKQQHALLEISEVNTPITGEHLEFLNHADDIAQQLIKNESPPPPPPKVKTKVNTFTVIEETKSDYHNENHHHHHHHHQGPTKVETIKIIDTHEQDHHHHHGDHHAHDHHAHDYHSHDHHAHDHHAYDHHNTHHDHHDHNHHVQDHHLNDGYHYPSPAAIKTPQIETVKVIETHVSPHDHSHDHTHSHDHSHSHDDSYSHDHSHSHYDSEYRDDGYHYPAPSSAAKTKTIKIIETKVPKAQHGYSSDYHSYNKRPVEEVAGLYQAPAHKHHHDHHHDHHHEQPADHHNHHTPTHAQETGYHYDRPATPNAVFDEGSENDQDTYVGNQEYTPPTSPYIPPPPLPPLPYAPVVPKRTASPSYHHDHHHQHHEVENEQTNTLYDDEYQYLPPNHASHVGPHLTANTAWPERENKDAAAETYTGVDSYNVPHVQGLGSGGYHYPSPYP